MTDSYAQVIQIALTRCGIKTDPLSLRSLSIGQRQSVLEVRLSDGSALVAKITHHESPERLDCEADGLRALQNAGTLRVPVFHAPCVVDKHTVLLMEALACPKSVTTDERAWAAFGRDLAEHHRVPQGNRYGWARDNFIGGTLQPNTWCDDWVEFNQEYRLGYQFRLAAQSGKLSVPESDAIQRVIDRLDTYIPRTPPPSLLHGDLWTGNAIPAQMNGELRIGVIDPAVSIGDGWADIAMMKLFGGFPECCFQSYTAAAGICDHPEERLLVYQLYHALNHVNLFGGGYSNMVMGIARRLVGR